MALIAGLPLLIVLGGCFIHITAIHDEMKSLRVQVADRTRERDTAYKLFTDCQERAKNFQDLCEGRNCDGLFNNDAAGVISTAYVGYDMDIGQLFVFCNSDERVNIGRNFPGAALHETKSENRTLKGGWAPNYLVTCSWIIPSETWCSRDWCRKFNK